MVCAWCRAPMGYVHGHAACLDGSCPMFGLNQGECCGGETAVTCPAPTSDIAGADKTFVSDGDGRTLLGSERTQKRIRHQAP